MPTEKDEDAPKVHRPEFVILEGDNTHQKEEEFTKEETSYFHTFQNVSHMKFPIFLRFFVFVVSAILFAASFVFLTLFVIAAIPALFGQNQAMIRFWKGYRRMLVFSLGLFVATFSPPLGISIILMYLFMLGEPVDSKWTKWTKWT